MKIKLTCLTLHSCNCLNLHNYDEAYPLKLKQPTKRNSPIQPWMTRGLLTSTRKKEKLYIKYVKNPTAHNKAIFTNYRNKYKLVRQKTEQLYYTNEFIKYSNDI